MTQGGRAVAGSGRVTLFLIVGGMLAGLLIVYTIRARPPRMPADADHLSSVEPARCLTCHGPGTQRPRGPKHPLNDQCLNCHERG